MKLYPSMWFSSMTRWKHVRGKYGNGRSVAEEKNMKKNAHQLLLTETHWNRSGLRLPNFGITLENNKPNSILSCIYESWKYIFKKTTKAVFEIETMPHVQNVIVLWKELEKLRSKPNLIKMKISKWILLNLFPEICQNDKCLFCVNECFLTFEQNQFQNISHSWIERSQSFHLRQNRSK